MLLPASRTLTSSSLSSSLSPRRQVFATGKAIVRASLPPLPSTTSRLLRRSPSTTQIDAGAIPVPSPPSARRTAMAAASSPSSATAVVSTKDKTVRFLGGLYAKTMRVKEFPLEFQKKKKKKASRDFFSQPLLSLSLSLSLFPFLKPPKQPFIVVGSGRVGEALVAMGEKDVSLVGCFLFCFRGQR